MKDLLALKDITIPSKKIPDFNLLFHDKSKYILSEKEGKVYFRDQLAVTNFRKVFESFFTANH